jgi:hypothetical protein
MLARMVLMMKYIFILFILILSANHIKAKLPVVKYCSSICTTKTLVNGNHCLYIDKRELYYRVLGKGKPTIVFVSGTGFPAQGWFQSGIATALSKKTRVFAYDRLYTFNSCMNHNNFMPNTAKDVVERLRKLLIKAKIKPPYILVGHSFGGLYSLLYAREYPEEVAGLLLMDASSSAGPTPLPKSSIQILKKLGNPQNPTPTEQTYNEVIGQLPSYLEMRNAPALPKTMPLIVMYATTHCLPKSLTKGKLMCMTKKQEENHVKQQLEIYNMSDKHFLYKVVGLHMSFFDKKNLKDVICAIDRLLAMARKHNI